MFILNILVFILNKAYFVHLIWMSNWNYFYCLSGILWFHSEYIYFSFFVYFVIQINIIEGLQGRAIIVHFTTLFIFAPWSMESQYYSMWTSNFSLLQLRDYDFSRVKGMTVTTVCYNLPFPTRSQIGRKCSSLWFFNSLAIFLAKLFNIHIHSSHHIHINIYIYRYSVWNHLSRIQ